MQTIWGINSNLTKLFRIGISYILLMSTRETWRPMRKMLKSISNPWTINKLLSKGRDTIQVKLIDPKYRPTHNYSKPITKEVVHTVLISIRTHQVLIPMINSWTSTGKTKRRDLMSCRIIKRKDPSVRETCIFLVCQSCYHRQRIPSVWRRKQRHVLPDEKDLSFLPLVLDINKIVSVWTL